jgi:catechol 2,3-dioxygenase-like lactoylglutathione lyase family enzyme
VIQFKPGEINIICSSLEQSRRFYCDVLGFEPVSEEGGAVHLQCGGRLYLLLPVAARPAGSPPYCAQPEFSMDLMVADIEAAAAYLRDHQVTFVRAWHPGAVSFIIRDPDGLVWEIIQQNA